MMNYQISSMGDISDADGTVHMAYLAPYAGRLSIAESTLVWTEATGTQSGTQGVLSIEVAGTEYATLTAPQSAALGTAQHYTVVPSGSTDAGNPVVDFEAGDSISMLTKTQAVGGTITGDGVVCLAITFAA